MTPALLQGFQTRLDSTKGRLQLVESAEPLDYVQGMLLLGPSKADHDCIDKHYRSQAQRVKISIEVDVQSTALPCYRISQRESRRIERMKVYAHAWVAPPEIANVSGRTSGPRLWTLEDYLSNDEDEATELRVSPSGDSDDEADGGVSLLPELSEVGQFGLARGGYGLLDYERVESGWAGW